MWLWHFIQCLDGPDATKVRLTVDRCLESSIASVLPDLTTGVALVDLSTRRGRLQLTGDDSIDLLNRLSTNDLKDLNCLGTGAATVFVSNKGRIIDLVHILRRGDHLLALTSGTGALPVAQQIAFYTIMEDVVVADVSSETVHYRLLGEKVTELLQFPRECPPYGSVSLDIDGINCLGLRSEFGQISCIDLLAPAKFAAPIQAIFMDAGATALTDKSFERLRILMGEPGHGAELSGQYNPLEAGLRKYISFNKGCYIGQEVIARLNAYDKVQRRLVRLAWSEGKCKEGAELRLQGKLVGILTSATCGDGPGLGIGYVRRVHAVRGTVLNCSDVNIVIDAVPHN